LANYCGGENIREATTHDADKVRIRQSDDFYIKKTANAGWS